MKFVKAQWLEPTFPGGDRIIKATGDDGSEWFVPSETSDVPPWPDFLAEGGVIDPAEEPPT